MRTTSRTLTAITLVLLSLGIVMMASASSVKGSHTYDDPTYFLKRQVAWLLIAAVAGWVALRFDYHWWQKLATPIGILAVLLLGIVLIPGIGTVAGGSRRWLRIAPLSFQPSEFAKLAVVVVLSAWMARTGKQAGEFLRGFLLPAIGLGVVLLLILREPDFGTTILAGTVGVAIMFAGGTKLKYLSAGGGLAACGLATAIFLDPVRRERVLAFFRPEEHAEKSYHLVQSMNAFILGGLFGVGLGNSIQKQFYLPEAQTDFILAIIGEELGFFATILVILLFIGILVCGMVVSVRAPDLYGRLLAFGITLMITLQAAINIGVVTGCLPTKGLPLPFISYGGSSLVMSVTGICILLNVAKHCDEAHEDEHTHPVRDGMHRF